MNARICAVSLSTSLMILLTACSTTGTQTAPAAQPVRITRGMSADQIYDLLGQPDEIKVMDEKTGIESETWIYLRTSRETGMTQVGMRDTVIFDSIMNEARIVQEAITTPVTNQTVERLELIMVQGEVADWTQVRTSDQDFTNH